MKTLIAAVQAGMGVALLPRPNRYLYEGLIPLPIDTRGVTREIWLVVHRKKRDSKPVQKVMEFLSEVISKPLKPECSGQEKTI